jgi:hypothetical protein
VVFAGWRSGNEAISYTGALALAIGIAIQNFPEGAIISMPLRAEGMKKRRAFIDGMLSGAALESRNHIFYSWFYRNAGAGCCTWLSIYAQGYAAWAESCS